MRTGKTTAAQVAALIALVAGGWLTGLHAGQHTQASRAVESGHIVVNARADISSDTNDGGGPGPTDPNGPVY
jgi:hypothetical protein